jgi:hypothetical protein
VLLAAAGHKVPVRDATPNEVKSAVAGYGAADKEQVARMVRTVLSLAETPHPDDAADALAIAIWTVNRERAGERLNAGVLDRAAVAPHEHGESPYERAVREAMAKERAMLEQWDGTPFATGRARPKAAAPRRSRSATGEGA